MVGPVEHFLVLRKRDTTQPTTMPRKKMRRPRYPRRRLPAALASAIARKALTMAKQTKKMVNKTIENKQVNYYQLNQNITSTGIQVGNFLSTQVGAEDGTTLGSSARIGNSITLLNQRFNMNITASSTDTFNQIRVLIVESLDGNQPLALTDVLEYGSYTLYGQLVFASPYTTKTATNRRYKVHYDRSFVLTGLPTKGGAPPTKVIKHNIKYGKTGKVVEYPGSGNVDPTNHRVTMLLISDSVSSAHPQLNYSTRATYKDA